MLASFLGPFIIHPVLEAIYESGGHLPPWGTAEPEREMEVKNIKYTPSQQDNNQA